MKRVIAAAVVAGLSAWALAQETAPAPTSTSAAATAPATAPTSPEALAALKLLEDRGGTLRDFSAKLRYAVEHVRDGTTETNRGEANYVKDAAAGSARVAIVLDDLVVNGAIAKSKLDHRFVFDGTWLIEKDPEKKIFRQIQLVSEKVKANPFKLRGPLPMPIGQPVAGVLQDFAAAVEPEKKGDPANTTHLKLTPSREGVYNFKQLDLWIDKSPDVLLPVKMVQINLDENITTTTLKDIKINTGDAGRSPLFDVTTPAAGAGWSIERHPLEEKPAPPATAPATAP